MRGLALLLLLAALGCRSSEPPAAPSTSPYQEQSESDRKTAQAERLSEQAADLVASDPREAESLLRDALGNDLFFGPAHNNLGVLLLKQGKLYQAANEFEWARKLMPGHPDPRVNLAITLEKAGKTDEAISSYSAALEVYPDYLPAMQGLACLMLRSGRTDHRLRTWLEAVAFREDDPVWSAWARDQLVRLR